MFKSKMRAFTKRILNVLGFKVKRTPELKIDGALVFIKTTVSNQQEYVSGVDIAYLPEGKRYYNFALPVSDISPREFIENHLEGMIFIAPDKHKYQMHFTKEKIDEVLSEGKITVGEHDLTPWKSKEYTLNINIAHALPSKPMSDEELYQLIAETIQKLDDLLSKVKLESVWNTWVTRLAGKDALYDVNDLLEVIKEECVTLSTGREWSLKDSKILSSHK